MASEVASRPQSPRLCSKFPFVVGFALGSKSPDFPDLAEHFNGVTPENCMKMSHLQPAEGCFRWTEADALVEFAAARNMAVHGHTLVWATDERTPEWVFRDGDKPASRPLVLERLKKHILAVVGRYRGKVASWDVVNEALGDADPFLRRSGWTALVGPDFIAQAFEWAHEADPAALLYYNDYGIEVPLKREKLLRLLRTLTASGAPVHAVGVQCHWEVDGSSPVGDLDALLAALDAFGLKAAVSELDVGLDSRALWYRAGGEHRAALQGSDPYALGPPADAIESQATLYADVFRLLCRRSRCVVRATLWGLHDGQSWLNAWPWNRTEHPLLFDRAGTPKPAFAAVMAVGESLGPPAAPSSTVCDIGGGDGDAPLPNEWESFREQGRCVVDEISNYFAALKSGSLPTRSGVKPGYLRERLPSHAPEVPEALDAVLADFHEHIVPGVTHWQSPSFFAYFPAQTSAPGILGDMLSSAIGCIGFSWAASPACTELETITTDWLAELIGLPQDFQSAGAGGGVIQGSASEATLVALLAARARALARLQSPDISDDSLAARLVVYASDQAHSSVRKAAMVAGVQPACFRAVASLPGSMAVSVEALQAAMAEDVAAGRVPCFVVATLGTTSSGAFDDLAGVVAAAREHAAWVHVDAAWAGSAFICPELRAGRLDGVEGVDSFDFNPHKWLRVPFDCRYATEWRGGA